MHSSGTADDDYSGFSAGNRLYQALLKRGKVVDVGAGQTVPSGAQTIDLNELTLLVGCSAVCGDFRLIPQDSDWSSIDELRRQRGFWQAVE